jgi:hypothetical protein
MCDVKTNCALRVCQRERPSGWPPRPIWRRGQVLAQKALDNFSSSPALLPEQGSDRSSGILAQCKLGQTACLVDGEGSEGLFYFRDGGRGHA